MKKFSFDEKFDSKFIYPTNHDAVCFITKHTKFESLLKEGIQQQENEIGDEIISVWL